MQEILNIPSGVYLFVANQYTNKVLGISDDYNTSTGDTILKVTKIPYVTLLEVTMSSGNKRVAIASAYQVIRISSTDNLENSIADNWIYKENSFRRFTDTTEMLTNSYLRNCGFIKDVFVRKSTSSRITDAYGRLYIKPYGTVSELPNLLNKTVYADSGLCYWATDLRKPLFFRNTDNKFYNADGYIYNIRTSGTFSQKPTVAEYAVKIGFAYFCTDRQTSEGSVNGIVIYHKGDDIWVDALGRVVE